MKHSRKTTRNVLLTCVVAVTLLCGIYAAPAFASHDESLPADANAAGQQDVGTVDSPDQGDASMPNDAEAPEGDAMPSDDGQEVDVTTPETSGPSGPLDIVAKAPGVFRDEMVKLFANATDTRQVITTPEPQSNWNWWPQGPYNRIRFSIEKTWKDANGRIDNQPRTPDGKVVDRVTFRVEGFVDWNDNGTLEEWEKTASKEYRGINTGHIARANEGEEFVPYYKHDTEGVISDDLNNDGRNDSRDNFFGDWYGYYYGVDNRFDRPDPKTGELGSIQTGPDDEGHDWGVFNRIIAPYQVYNEYVHPHWSIPDQEYRWSDRSCTGTSSLAQEFYEFQLYTTEVTEVVDDSELAETEGAPSTSTSKVNTVSYVFDENGNPKGHKIIYTVTELPIDGYSSTRSSRPVEVYKGSRNLTITDQMIRFTNVPDGYAFDKTGQIVIRKSFDGPIYANGYEGADGSSVYNEGNASVAVFHIVGNTSEDGTGETLFDAYRSLSFYADGASSQSIVIDNLPIDVWYTVTEVAFDGSGYVAKTGTERKFLLVPRGESEWGEWDGPVGDEPEGEGGITAFADDPNGDGDELDVGDGDASDVTTYFVYFSNKGTLTESPNQGWVNRYVPDEETVYAIEQIQRTENLS